MVFQAGLTRPILNNLARFLRFLKPKNPENFMFVCFHIFLFSSRNFYFFMSNSVNCYEFIGFIRFNIEAHELVYVYSFLVDRILVSNVPRATVRRH